MAERTCSRSDCDRPQLARGWCRRHYARWQRNGTTDDIRPTVEQRFWAKVDKGDGSGCWLWMGYTGSTGYGHLYVDGAPKPAHRVAYELLVGPIPDGLTLDHLCRVRRCVKPAHLEPVTNRENIVRGSGFAGVNARKTACDAGHPLEGANLYITPTGERSCRACRRQRTRRLRGRA